MRAYRQQAYGLENLSLDEVEVPKPSANQVLIEVEAASINPADWYIASGRPAILRLSEGLRRPKKPTPGTDVAGVVKKIGDEVASLAIGDRIFGKSLGAFAEYAIVIPARAAKAPVAVPPAELAGLPIAGVTALQAVEKGKVEGKKVLVNGASGGVGHYAVQIAKAAGAAEVIGVCSERNRQLVMSLGVDQVIEYNTQDFTDDKYDVILDCIGSKKSSQIAACLRPGGKWVLIGSTSTDSGLLGPIPKMFGAATRFGFTKNKECLPLLADETTERLDVLASLYSEGKIKTVIGKEFPLSEVPAAYAYLGTKRSQGKTIIRP